VLPSLKYWPWINVIPTFTVSFSVRSVKLTLLSALTAHLAREKTIEMLSRDTPDFTSPLQWPPNSSDLKQVDYAISGSRRRSSSSTRESVTSTTSLSDSWRNGPDLTTRHQCCSCSVASSSASQCEGGQRAFWTLFTTIDEWSHCFVGETEHEVYVVVETCVFDV